MKLRGCRLPAKLASKLKPAGPPLPPTTDMRPVRMRVHLPPSTNDMWTIGFVRGKPRMVATVKQVLYKQAIRLMLAGKVRPWSCEVAIRVVVHFDERDTLSDTTNRGKVLEDALQGFVYENDLQTADFHTTRGEPVAAPHRPYADVIVTPWLPDEALKSQLRHVAGELGVVKRS